MMGVQFTTKLLMTVPSNPSIHLYLKVSHKKEGDRAFSRVCGDRTRGNGFKLKECRFRLDIRKKYFTARGMTHWNRLPSDMVDALSLVTFKSRRDQA